MLKRVLSLAIFLSFISSLYIVAPANAVELDAGSIAKRKEIIHRCLLNIYLAQKKRPSAKTEYEIMVGLKPDNSQLQFEYGSFLAAGQEYGPGLVHLKKAVTLDPTNPKYQGTVGSVLLKMKKPDEALKYLREAVQYGGKEYQKYYEDTYKFIDYQKRVDQQKKQQEAFKKQQQQQQAVEKKAVDDDDDW